MPSSLEGKRYVSTAVSTLDEIELLKT